MARLLLFTGKGGVGKTTLAAATAARLAQRGRKALVVSTDPAHSLADALGTEVSAEPSEVDSSLHAAQIDARVLLDSAWPTLRERVRGVLVGAGLAELEAEELTVVPGVDDVLALSEVARMARTGPWDAVVVDCGPTAETLRLLALPEAVGAYVDRAFRLVPRGVNSAIAELGGHVRGLRSLLSDPAATSVRLVFTPERVVVAETRRTLTALALGGVRVDGLVANRVVPKASRWAGPGGAWLRTRRSEQDVVLSEVDFGVPVRTVEYRSGEPIGVPALLEIAAELYGASDPLDGAPAAPPLAVDADGDGYRLTIALPLVDTAHLDLARVGDDLSVTVDGTRRLVALPLLLRRYTVTDAEADHTALVVRFAPGRKEHP